MGLAEYVMGRRTPREALARISWLPRGSAFAACQIARHGLPEAPKSIPAEMAWFEWGRGEQIAADLWDLTAAVATGKGEAPTYPGSPTSRARRGDRRRAQRNVDATAFPALLEAAANDN